MHVPPTTKLGYCPFTENPLRYSMSTESQVIFSTQRKPPMKANKKRGRGGSQIDIQTKSIGLVAVSMPSNKSAKSL